MAFKKKKKRPAVGKKKTSASKKPKPAVALFKQQTFKYSCQDHVCSVAPRSKRLGFNTSVRLIANGTNVTITFTSGTPFTSGGSVISLIDGTPQDFAVDNRSGTFRYTIQCSACGEQVGIPPEMIVP